MLVAQRYCCCFSCCYSVQCCYCYIEVMLWPVFRLHNTFKKRTNMLRVSTCSTWVNPTFDHVLSLITAGVHTSMLHSRLLTLTLMCSLLCAVSRSGVYDALLSVSCRLLLCSSCWIVLFDESCCNTECDCIWCVSAKCFSSATAVSSCDNCEHQKTNMYTCL